MTVIKLHSVGKKKKNRVFNPPIAFHPEGRACWTENYKWDEHCEKKKKECHHSTFFVFRSLSSKFGV